MLLIELTLIALQCLILFAESLAGIDELINAGLEFFQVFVFHSGPRRSLDRPILGLTPKGVNFPGVGGHALTHGKLAFH